MPVNGGSRGPGGNRNTEAHKMPKGSGPSANRSSSPPAGAPHFPAKGVTRGTPNNLHNGSPMKGPSMGGVLKYIRQHGSGEKTAPGSGDGDPLNHETSPIPTGGEPLPQKDQGHDVPGESHNEMEQECGHPGCTQHGKKKTNYEQSDKETSQFGKGR